MRLSPKTGCVGCDWKGVVESMPIGCGSATDDVLTAAVWPGSGVWGCEPVVWFVVVLLRGMVTSFPPPLNAEVSFGGVVQPVNTTPKPSTIVEISQGFLPIGIPLPREESDLAGLPFPARDCSPARRSKRRDSSHEPVGNQEHLLEKIRTPNSELRNRMRTDFGQLDCAFSFGVRSSVNLTGYARCAWGVPTKTTVGWFVRFIAARGEDR